MFGKTFFIYLLYVLLFTFSDAEAQNRRLHRELRRKDTIIQELRQTVAFLERRTVELVGDELPLKSGTLVYIYIYICHI